MAGLVGPSQNSTLFGTNPIAVANQGMPVGGQMAVPVFLDFTVQPSYHLDFTAAQWAGKINSVQSAYIDNSGGTTVLSIYCEIIAQTLIVPAGAQAYMPLVCASPPIFDVTCANGAQDTQIIFLNVPMPIDVWFPKTSNPSYDGSGNEKVNDINTAAALTGSALATAGTPTVMTDRSVVTAATPASTALMGAATWRKYLLIQAPAGADIWLNPKGGTAGIGLSGCVKIGAGLLYEAPSYVWQGAITYYCATGGLVLTAYEG